MNQPIPNSLAIRTPAKAYLCPTDLTPPDAFAVSDAFGAPVVQGAACSYAGCIGGDETGTSDQTGLGVFYRNSRTAITDISDGASQTLFIGERAWAIFQCNG